MMKSITFEIETITPMFLSGAVQAKAELRAASIKGLLRYWWRALQAESNLDKLRERESKIFGSADEKKGGRSSFSIRITHDGELKTIKKPFPDNPIYKIPIPGKSFKMNILQYLAYGAFDNKKGFRGDYIDSGQKFSIIINVIDEKSLHEILKTVYVFNMFGCIGSRNRNGFGSFHIVNRKEALKDLKDAFSLEMPYDKKNIRNLIKKTAVAAYSSFSEGTKVFQAMNTFNTAFDALADIGKIYKNARGSLERTHQFDRRQYIGAPLDPPRESFKSFLDRHAKPYFIKIAKEGDKYRAYILYLTSRYCDGREKDRNNHIINHDTVDSKFTEVCAEFNSFLAKQREHIVQVI